jgi:hypothetical protein
MGSEKDGKTMAEKRVISLATTLRKLDSAYHIQAPLSVDGDLELHGSLGMMMGSKLVIFKPGDKKGLLVQKQKNGKFGGQLLMSKLCHNCVITVS